MNLIISLYRKTSLARLLWIVNVISVPLFAQRPEIKSLDKPVASPSQKIAIKGESFGTDATKVSVFFGAAKGTIEAIDNQLIEVKVPAGATYNTVSVANTTTGRIGYSKENFLLSFNGTHPFDVTNLRPQVDFEAESGLYDLCLCDANADGKSEIFATNDIAGGLFITQSTNTSTPGTINFTKVPKLLNVRSIHVDCGDLNGDGKPDQVFTEGGTGNRISIYLNGSSSVSQTIPLSGVQTKRVEIADIDLDGRPEIIVTDKGAGRIAILSNQSTLSSLSFIVKNITITGATTMDGLAVADLNGDGLPEIITNQFVAQESNLFILPNNSVPGTISMGSVITLPMPTTLINIRAGDLDGDGKSEIAVTDFASARILIYPNQSTSTISFGTPNIVAVDVRPWGLDFGDLDGDGKTDIVVAHIGAQKSFVILNNESTPGNLTFQKIVVPANFVARHVTVGDVDGDGKPDIAFANLTASKISIFRNAACMTPKISPEAPAPVCVGGVLKLSSTESAGTTYEWKKDGTAISGATSSSYTIPTTAIAAASDYTVTMTSTIDACTKTSNIVPVTVSNGSVSGTPTATNNGNGSVCAGSPLELNVNAIGTGYRWLYPSGAEVAPKSTDTKATVTDFQLSKAGRYTVEIYSGDCVAATASTIVGVVEAPNLTINSGGNIICLGDTKTLTVPALTGFTYQWFKNNVSISGQTTPALAVTETGDYKASASFPGCTTIETQPVSIISATPPTAAFSAPAGACTGQLVKFTNESTSDPNIETTYAWTFGDGGTSDRKNPEYSYTTAFNHSVKLKVSYQGGSCLKEATKVINVQATPPAKIRNAENKYIFCPGESLRLQVTGSYLSYEWSTSETTASITVTEGGVYKVKVTTANCSLNDSIQIETYAAPQVVVSAFPELLNEGESSELTATGLVNYEWSPAETLSNPNIPDPIATPLESTEYKVTGKDTNGCRGDGSVFISVNPGQIRNKLEPQAFFSPNGDAENPSWVVNKIDIYPTCRVTIYDEKGIKVFEAKPYLNDWDGTFQGKRLPDGVYYFIIRCDGEEDAPRSGSITLLR